MKRAIFSGTFDPFTLGHFDILKRSKQLFDEIIVGIGKNSEKEDHVFIEGKSRIYRKSCQR